MYLPKLALVCALVVYSVGGDTDDIRYIVTIDGGSTGTRVHVHEIIKHPGSSSLPHIKAVRESKKVKRALSEKSEADAAGIVEELLVYAATILPEGYKRKTPVFLKATGGLRSMVFEDVNRRLKACGEVISNSVLPSFGVRNRILHRDVSKPYHSWKVIDGEEEGTFGWMAANYLSGRLDGQPNAHLGTIGVIEMGGASMQVSFVPKKLDGVSKRVPIKISNQEYPLYTQSFLGLGLTQAHARYQASLEEIDRDNPKSTKRARSPCRPDVNVPGDFGQCLAKAKPLLPLDVCESAPSCTFNGVFLPSMEGVEFIGIENFFHTGSFFGVADTPSELNKVAHEWCSKDLGAFRGKFGQDLPEDRVERRCFSAAFIHYILTDGLKMDASLPNVKFVNEIDHVAIGWVIGSVLFEIGELPKYKFQSSGILALPQPLPRRLAAEFWLALLPAVILACAYFLLRKGFKRSPVRYSSIGTIRGGVPGL